jgi:EAL domain-containing protein (putative c-di-GMP-specific phosphodiesterase class I)
VQRWQEASLGRLRLAVNISPLQFMAPDLATRITRIVERTGIRPADVELEITESTLMGDIDAAARTMRVLKSRGMTITIDDFGTGYSSLASLRHFPLDGLKVDRAFVREIGDNADAEEIVIAIIAMAKRLRLHIVAEGVERSVQAEFLSRQDCNGLQGFLYSRPLDATGLEALLRDRLPAAQS